MAKTTDIASGANSAPPTPPRNMIGTKTMQIDRVATNAGVATSADHVPGRRRRGAVRAAGDVRRLRHAGQLLSLADARPDHGAVPAGPRGAGRARSRRGPRRAPTEITVRADRGLVRGRLRQTESRLRGRAQLGARAQVGCDHRVPRLRVLLAG